MNTNKEPTLRDKITIVNNTESLKLKVLATYRNVAEKHPRYGQEARAIKSAHDVLNTENPPAPFKRQLKAQYTLPQWTYYIEELKESAKDISPIVEEYTEYNDMYVDSTMQATLQMMIQRYAENQIKDESSDNQTISLNKEQTTPVVKSYQIKPINIINKFEQKLHDILFSVFEKYRIPEDKDLVNTSNSFIDNQIDIEISNGYYPINRSCRYYQKFTRELPFTMRAQFIEYMRKNNVSYTDQATFKPIDEAVSPIQEETDATGEISTLEELFSLIERIYFKNYIEPIVTYEKYHS